MRRYLKTFSVLLINLAVIGFGAVSVQATTISDIQSYVDALPVEDFNEADSEMKLAVQNDLTAISEILDLYNVETEAEEKASQKTEAIESLNYLKAKTEGCNLDPVGTAGEDDRITNCTSQADFIALVDDLVAQLEAE